MAIWEDYGVSLIVNKKVLLDLTSLWFKFMHNGGIAEFPKIKRRLQTYLSDEIFNMVSGNTGLCLTFCVCNRNPKLNPLLDSQWAFALFLSKVCFFKEEECYESDFMTYV